ncbi:LbetaH domain-containing protein [Paramagnetospirillum kuznetsovii]|nr:hypothetical protein [Paramagnetospirillum kuznetsovii]
MDKALAPFEPVFMEVLSKIADEHTLFKARYFRDESGTPLVNPLNIEHLTRLLHPFTRRLFLEKAPEALLDCLFAVSKSYCGLNLFYRTEEIDLFVPQHALGSVIGYCEFGPFIVMHQNCNIGHNHGRYPSIEGGLWMGPSSSILGGCKVGRNVRMATGAMVIDRDIPDDVIVFGIGRDVRFKANTQDNRLMILDESRLTDVRRFPAERHPP